jgi:hypothetical protein
MTDDEILSVVQAHKEGKKIEFKHRFDHHHNIGEWYLKDGDWDFVHFIYRVAPEPRKPREWRVCVNDNGHIFEVKTQDPHHCIIVREVIE